jgi:hypothetical protein
LDLKNIPNYQFSALFLFVLSDIHLIFNILLCHTKIQTKFEFGGDPLIFHEIMTLGLRKILQIISFLHFFRCCFQIFFFLIFGTLLWHVKIQIKFEFGFDPLIFHKVMTLDFDKYHKLSVFHTFLFVLSDHVHFIFGICFAIPRYSSRSSLVLMYQFSTNLWP